MAGDTERVELNLFRYEYGLNCTLGLILLGDVYMADSLELPWLSNHVKISCIPEGVYSIVPTTTAHLGDCLQILSVPGRTAIYMHSANYVKELLGCIAAGTKCGETVSNSHASIEDILKHVNAPATLTVQSMAIKVN